MSNDTQPVDATPGDDLSGLLASNLTTRTARNAAETDAIGRAYDKHIFRARGKKRGSKWLTDQFIRTIHHDMFGAIWDWAGKFRTIRLNIGVEPHQIREQIQLLCGDFDHWDSGNMPVLEVATRLQNRLTRIHPFKNGNGRHARLITDIFFYSRKHPLPQWPQIQLMSQGHEIREQYIAAMKKADQEDFSALIHFIEGCISTPS